MNADEMFEKLGYEKEEIVNGFQYYLGDDLGDDKEIDFIENIHNKNKEIWIDSFHIITIQELKAINQKCKELGWLDE